MKPNRMVIVAIVFEAALGAAGWITARSFGIPMAPRLQVTSATLGRSCVALVPMLALLAFGLRTNWPPLARLREQVEALVGSLFGDVPWWGLAAAALAAGVGEELLFRGALQPLTERWLGAAVGLVVVSVVFGALHAASTAYFVLATVVGLYLGWLAQHFNDLIAPILVHAAYDFAALCALCRWSSSQADEITP
jgi:membrane protease YdiL (CAAX protease family)